MAPNLTLQQQQAVAKAKARARASQAGVEPLGGASGEWDLSKFEALPKPAQTKPLANTINAPNPITTAVQQSQQKAGQDWVTNKAAADAARKERTLYNAASGMAFTGGEDGSMPQLNTDPGPLFSDLGKGVVTSPIRAERGVVSGVESILNFPSDVADFLNSANKPEYRSKPVPRVDFSGAKIPVPQELDSVSGMLGEGLAQFLVSRKMVGSMAPGGGLAPQLAKDAAATFVGFDGKTGRLADIIDSNAVPAGPMRDYLEFLKTQPDDSPLVGRFKNLLEDMTASSAMVAPLPVARAGLEAMKPKPGAVAAATPSPAPVRPAAPAAQPSPAPVTAIPQTPPRPAQGGPASPGQQPTAGPAPAAPGVTGGQGGGVLNAVPAAPVVSKGEVRVAKDTAKILSRIMRSSRINDADVRGYLPGAVQRYKGLNDPSVPFAFFLEGDLPQHFPQPIAEEVVTKLQTWGRERNAATGPQDTSRRTIQQTVKTLREGQQDYLSGVMDQNLYKGKLIGQEDKLKASLKANAQTAYDTALQNANNGLLSGRATVDQRNALGKIQELLHNDAFLKQVPQHLRIKAMREGIDLEDFVQKDPLAAAHWLQSELRQAVSAAEGVGGSATSESRLYGEMRQALLDQLETAVPGYKGARKAHGDIYGAVEALDFGNSFFKAARSEVETARLARQFKALSKRQQTAATMSIRDALKNEFRNKAEDTAAKVTRLQQAGVLEALETVLGADGKRVADGIRNIVKQNDRLKAIDQGSGSPTYSNQRGGEAAREMVQSPVNKAVGQFGDKTSWPVTIAGDIMLGTQGIPPLLTTSKVASAVVDRFGNPSPKMLSRATEGLYGLPAPPPANALSGPPTPRGGRPRVPAPPPTQQTLDDLLREYDAIDHRKEPGKAAQVLKKIDALKKRLAKDEANALSAPPSPPVKGPVNKAGFFGSGSKPLDMSEAGRMQRAREQGYTIEAYHGTRRDFDEFDVNEAGSNFSQDEGTIHFTDDAKDADRYAMSDTTGMPAEGGSTYPVLLRMKKPLVADRAFFEREGMGNVYANEDRISAWDTYHPFLKERAEEMGADGIILKDSFGKSHYVVFDPKNVRSKFATFDPSQSGSSKLLAGMGKGTGGRIASQVGPPAFAATVASVGPEGEPYEDKLKRMGVAALAASGARNAGAIMRGVNALKGGAKAAERVPEQSGFFGGKGPPKPANDMLPKGQKTPAEDLAMAREFNKEPLTPERAYDFWVLLKDEKDLNKVIDVLDINLNPSILSLPRGRAMVERTREEVLRRVTTYLRKETEANKASTLSRANAKFEENNRSIANEITQLRERGVPDQMIARSLGLEDGSLEYFLRWSEPTKPPPAQAGFFSGGKGPPKGNRLVLGKRTIEELQRASKLLSPDARQAIADNAAKPPSMRVSAAEASGDDPSLYALAAPFQNIKKPLVPNPARTFRNALAPNSRIANKLAGPPIRNPIAEGVQTGLGRIDQRVGSPPPLDSAAETARLAEKQRRAAASEATRTANKLNPYVNEAAGIPDKPLPKSVARREDETTQLAIAARDVLKSSRLSAEDYAAAVKWADKKKQDIADALVTGRTPAASGPVATSANVLAGGAGKPMKPRLGKPVSRAEAQDMAGLLFDREQAALLDDVLSGRVTPKNRSDHHYALLLAASLGGAGVGIAAMASNLREDGLPFTPKAPVAEPPDPRWKDDPEKTSTDYKRIKEAQVMMSVIFDKQLVDDGKMIRKDGKPSKTQEFLRRFQWEHQDDYGLEVTGMLDADTYQALGEVYREKLRTAAPRHAQTTMQ